jgi:ABC-2 type transport system permease protein
MQMTKFIRDTQLLLTRSIVTTLRNPVWVILGLFQPVVYLLLFAPLLDGLEHAPGFPSGGAFNVFTPGLLIMTSLLGTAFVGFGFLADLRAGVIERLRVTPVSRMALLLGRVLRDVAVLLVQSVLLVLVASVMGLKADPLGVIVACGLIALIGVVMSSCSYALALFIRDENGLAPMLNMVTIPLLLLSGIMLPLTLAPQSIRTIAAFNPLAYAVDAARALFNGDFGSTAIVSGFTVIGVLAILALWWAARSFRHATA